MSKYCAEDLRNAAEDVENYSGYDEDIIADMLRFAADVLDHEKKYEYGVQATDSLGTVLFGDRHFNNSQDADRAIAEICMGGVVFEKVRREVGEWEKA